MRRKGPYSYVSIFYAGDGCIGCYFTHHATRSICHAKIEIFSSSSSGSELCNKKPGSSPGFLLRDYFASRTATPYWSSVTELSSLPLRTACTVEGSVMVCGSWLKL